MRLIIASIAFTLTATSAYAADAIVAEEVIAVPDTFSWTGGYVGINAGYAGGKFKTDFTDLTAIHDDRSLLPGQLHGLWSVTASGFVGGVQAGYNWQFENGLVIGVEADFQGSTLKSEIKTTDRYSTYSDYGKLTTKVEWWGTVRARLGYTPVEKLLVYTTGGLAYGKVKNSYSFDRVYSNTYTDQNWGYSNSKTRAGWTVGAGAEYSITNNWTLKSEYLYTDLGKTTGYALLNDISSGDVTSDVKFHTVRVGLNYKF
ncbi:outer membrane protein [Brucellaceae bacterium C25G]